MSLSKKVFISSPRPFPLKKTECLYLVPTRRMEMPEPDAPHPLFVDSDTEPGKDLK